MDKMKHTLLLIIVVIVFISGCVNQAEKETIAKNEVVTDNDKSIPTCEQRGGKCADPLIGKCSGIKFEIGSPVSDCPGNCCVCCKQIISECVPAECCHAKSCVLKQLGPNCAGIVCTQECRDGTMDCGQGKCEFDERAESYCKVVLAES